MTEKQVDELLNNMVDTFEKHQKMINIQATLLSMCAENLRLLKEKVDKLELSLSHTKN